HLLPVARAAPLPGRPRRGAVHGLRPSAGAALPQVAALLAGEGEVASARRDSPDAADHERLGALAARAAPRDGAGAAGPAPDARDSSPGARARDRQLVPWGPPLVSRDRGGGPRRPAALLGRLPAPRRPRLRFRAPRRPRRVDLRPDRAALGAHAPQ